jgi:hypothetical protein
MLNIGLALVKEKAAPLVEEEGLYFVIAKLNGNEENRIPFYVWQESGEGGNQDE